MPDSITPPPELIGRWEEDWHHSKVKHIELEDHIANEAAQWGADQELTECLRYASDNGLSATRMRETRRPKPPSLKEQALEQLACIQTDLNKFGMGISTNTIRRALEDLDD
jgi:hypothetical protein